MSSRVKSRIGITGMAIVLLLAGAPVNGQTSVVEAWRSTAPATNGAMMDLDLADNVFVVGESIQTVVLRKFSPTGVLQWERIDPPAPERARASWVSTDPAGNAIVAAYRITGGNNSPAGWIVTKYDPRGNVVWRDIIPGGGGQTVRVETDGAGNAYVTGKMFVGTTIDAVTIKYAPNGTKLWTRAFNGAVASGDVPSSIAVSSDGARIAVVGATGSSFFTVIYDAQGNEVGRSVRTDLFPARDAAFGPLNALYVGTTSWTPATSNRMTLVKFGAAGNTAWTRFYEEGDFIYRVAVDSSGDVVAVGAGNLFLDWITIKVGPDGTRRWSRLYSATAGTDEIPAFLTIDRANAIYVTGRAGPIPPDPGINLLMMTTIRYEPDGTQAWVVNRDIARGLSVRVGADQAVYVLGEGQMLTVRYDQVTGGVPGPPSAPTSLTVTTASRTAIGLQWANGPGMQTAVRIERCTGANCTTFVQVAQVGGSSTAYLDGGLVRNTTYRYRVRAANDHGNSAYSNIVTARTTK